jgi:acetyltransferase-like isoleucine patch superfamily enzyme
LGDYSFVDSDVSLGEGCVVGRLSSLMTKTHVEQTGSTRRRCGRVISCGRLSAGRHVNIGDRVLILPQVRQIGDGSQIKYGSIVNRDLAIDELWIGLPSSKKRS